MPVRKVSRGGKTCFKFGTVGKTFCGPRGRAKARRQGRAIKASQAKRGR